MDWLAIKQKGCEMRRGMAVAIRGNTFSSKKSARDHFMDQREKVQASGPLIEGELFVQLSELYARYCEADPSWKREGLIVQSFFVDYEPGKLLQAGSNTSVTGMGPAAA